MIAKRFIRICLVFRYKCNFVVMFGIRKSELVNKVKLVAVWDILGRNRVHLLV